VVLWHLMRMAVIAVLAALPMLAQVRIAEQSGGRIAVEINGRPFTTLYAGPETHKPYLHPLRAASGTVITRGYPMEKIAGESHDHPHHRGLWFAHGDVNGFDFWGNESAGGKFGQIVLAKVNRAAGGEQAGTIEAEFRWQDPAGATLLSESRRMVFYAQPDRRTIDFDITLTAREKVTFGDTKEGTFAVRLADGLTEPRGGHIVDALGSMGEKNVWGKRADWVDYSGELEGEPLGIAIFDHPSNPRHPTWWHVRSYGLFAANIFGLHDFEPDAGKDGRLTLAPGETLRFRYRVIVHPGNAKSADVARLYGHYTRGQ
jgi:hypothetical protein